MGPACLQDIDALCTECSSLIQNHDKIRTLSAVYTNLGKTLQDVDNIKDLKEEAEEAEALLQEDENLVQVCQQVILHVACLASQTT